MAEKQTQSRPDPEHWDVYWRSIQEDTAYAVQALQDAVLTNFWTMFFQQQLVTREPCRLLDIACGSGIVTDLALQVAPTTQVCGVDYSPGALMKLQQRHSTCECVITDIRQLPFANASFDIVVSQFGVEYAGFQAIVETARLVAPGGVFAAILHLQSGAIHNECARNLAAVEAIQHSGILPLAGDAFRAGFALNRGEGSVETFKSAELCLAPAVQALEQIMRNMGRDAAGGLAGQLYQDIAHIYPRMSAYEPDDVLGWLGKMEVELEAYNGRMSAMLHAGLDTEALNALARELTNQGYRVSTYCPVVMNPTTPPAAWALISEKQ